ncbi:tripartite tricarboxylate transporter TctB family protein [Pseudochelatococcus sp. B33]
MMLSRDYRDVAAGALLFVVGVAAAWHSVASNNLGTINRMGPGMFPMGLGYILAALGLFISISALFRQGVRPRIRVWTPIFVFSSVAAFAFLIRPFGLLPAIVALTIISSFAELKIRPLSLAALTLSLCLIAWLIFKVGLGLPIAMYRWPF